METQHETYLKQLQKFIEEKLSKTNDILTNLDFELNKIFVLDANNEDNILYILEWEDLTYDLWLDFIKMIHYWNNWRDSIEQIWETYWIYTYTI